MIKAFAEYSIVEWRTRRLKKKLHCKLKSKTVKIVGWGTVVNSMKDKRRERKERKRKRKKEERERKTEKEEKRTMGELVYLLHRPREGNN